jgi:hypothetical protein
LLAALAVLGLWATSAQAAWVKAETDRFVVYGDVAERVVEDYAVRLSTYDAILRLLNPRAAQAPARRKFEVYVVRDRASIRRVRPTVSLNTGGFYVAGPQATFAIASEASHLMGRDDALFHEYAHHFMAENFPAAYPAWFVEGWAEYYMTTSVTPQLVKVGEVNQNRLDWLRYGIWLPIEDVVSRPVSDFSGERRSMYYAQAWLLTHFLQSTPARAQAFNKAIQAIAGGEPPVQALEQATGLSMKQLGLQLQNYSRLTVATFKDDGSRRPKVTMTRLGASADDLLLERLRLTISDISKPDPAFLAAVRERAARHPGDALAELTLAHAEFTHGDVAAGEAIVARRLAANPNDADTQLLAGVGQMLAGERDPARKTERYRAARPYLSKAYELDKTDYRPLYGYALSRRVEPGFPTDNDINVLLQARSLGRAVADISLLTGRALIMKGKPGEARQALAFVANNPHGGGAAAQARALIEGKLDEADREGAAEEEEPQAPPPAKGKPRAK